LNHGTSKKCRKAPEWLRIIGLLLTDIDESKNHFFVTAVTKKWFLVERGDDGLWLAGGRWWAVVGDTEKPQAFPPAAFGE